MSRKIFIIVVLFQLFLSVGCSQNVKVTGNVTFTDGEPVKFGSVVFETPKNSYSARLNQDGFYSIGDTKDGAGIPEGDYKIWLAGTDEITETGSDENIETTTKPRVNSKYTNADKSGLKLEVKRGAKQKFDFKVERPE
ncbi:MAG: hypothetical protein LBP59_15215 [Planctomycetaceae bacterium]|jgi:hypothetical protein|nr:hypothetical protein [Planctomycetaceae bacterium]